MRRVLSVLVLAAAGVGVGMAVPSRAPAVAAAAAAAPADEVARADFDDDGFVDLAIGVPGEDPGDAISTRDAGEVVVLFGQAGGLTMAGEWTLSTGNLRGDRLGSSVAIGAPGRDVGAATDAGAVFLFGGATPGGELGPVLVQGAGGIGGAAERGDRFGAVLEAGQANSGGPADLVVGAPGETVGTAAGAGAVSVLYGAAGGPSAAGDQLFFQGGGGLPDEPEAGDGFGSALAVGRLGADAFPDLMVGVPGEEYFANADVGDGILLHGTAGGLSGAGSQQLILELNNVGSNESGDRIGSALAARDFDADGAGDLAVGIPGEDIDKLRDAGAIAYHQGPLDGPDHSESRPLHGDSAGVPGASEPGDRFGSVLGPGPLGS